MAEYMRLHQENDSRQVVRAVFLITVATLLIVFVMMLFIIVGMVVLKVVIIPHIQNEFDGIATIYRETFHGNGIVDIVANIKHFAQRVDQHIVESRQFQQNVYKLISQ